MNVIIMIKLVYLYVNDDNDVVASLVQPNDHNDHNSDNNDQSRRQR